jgi:hypothetical protein
MPLVGFMASSDPLWRSTLEPLDRAEPGDQILERP